MTDRADIVLDVQDLSVGYVKRDGSINHVVHDVCFALHRGAILGLAGESGCGKSTTALAAIGYRAPGLRILGGESMLDGTSTSWSCRSKRCAAVWGEQDRLRRRRARRSRSTPP